MHLPTILVLPAVASAAVLQERQLGNLLSGLLGGGSRTAAAPRASSTATSGGLAGLLGGLGGVGGLLGGLGGGVKLAGVEKLQPKVRKTAQRTLVKYGPYTLPAASGGSAAGAGGMMGGMMGGMDSTAMGSNFFFTVGPKDGFCNANGPCTVLAGKVGVMFTDGTPANPATGIFIHHILTSDTKKVQSPWLSTCGNPNVEGRSISAMMGGTGFVGTGEDSADSETIYTSEDGTRNSGFHVGAQDSFTSWSELVNYNKEPKNVYIYYDLEFVPGIQGEDIKGTLISATGCGTRLNLNPNGPSNTTSGKFYFMEDGRVVGGRGHLHDGGLAMNMLVNGKNVCRSRAEYGTRGANDAEAGHSHAGMEEDSDSLETIKSMTTCKDPVPVKKGDVLTLVAEYDLSKHGRRITASGSEVGGEMAMMGISFAADKK